MRLLVAGDSWGEGVRDRGHQLHPGIQAFFQDFGHTADNISLGGFSNTEILGAIRRFHEHSTTDLLLVFWTCPLREYKVSGQPIQDIQSWCVQYWQRIFTELDEILKETATPVISMGGLADIPPQVLQNFDYHMPSCCQYLMPNHHAYVFGDFNFVDRAFESMQLRYEVLTNIETKMTVWRQYQFKTMRSDAGHPSADGYRRIFEQLPRHFYAK